MHFLFIAYLESRLDAFPVKTKLADFGRRRNGIAVQAFFDFHNYTFNPIVLPLIRNNFHVKFKLRVKSLSIFLPVRINKVTCIRNFKIVFSEKPLINFHLPSVGIVVFGVGQFNFPRLGCGFVIYYMKLFRIVYPDIINGPENKKITFRMMILNPFEIISPVIQGFMAEGNGLYFWRDEYQILFLTDGLPLN